MFRKTLNQAVLRVRVETVTPLLIRSGDSGLQPGLADLTCVTTTHGRLGRTVYVPGSSLKGVVRSTAEALLRGREIGGIEGACNPLDQRSSKCNQRAERGEETAAVHARQCLACRTFGSQALKGRASIRDLFPWPEATGELAEASRENLVKANALEVRNGVAINRISGGVQHGPFDQEIVPAGVSFWGDVALENYQVWQLGLVAAALEELTTGFAQLGSSKSRGLGVVKVSPEKLLHEQPLAAGETPQGAGRLLDEGEGKAYGLMPEGGLPSVEGRARGLRRRFETEGAQGCTAWLDAGLEALGALS